MTPITSKCSFKSVLPSEHEEAYTQKNVSLHFFVARIRRTFGKKVDHIEGAIHCFPYWFEYSNLLFFKY